MTSSGSINSSEAFVAHLARKSFLSLWCYANPKGKPGRELCDVLVVCDPHVVIISVKDCEITDSGDPSVDAERWAKRAIEASAKQIYGAERRIRDSEAVVTRDGETALPFPEPSTMRVHRVAVAFGSKGQTWIPARDFGNGFVHVFDEVSLQIVMGELDTISDFTQYLAAKEDLLESSSVIMQGEENLLASYLASDREFDFHEADAIVIEEGLWGHFTSSTNYQNGRRANAISYRLWDKIIEEVCHGHSIGRLVGETSLTKVEAAVRCMAKESRFSRRVLSRAFIEFVDGARKGELRARYAPSMSGISYVFLAAPMREGRQARQAELVARSLVIRRDYPQSKTVVGIATETPSRIRGHTVDLSYLHVDEWNDELEQKALEAKNELGLFQKPKYAPFDDYEYPETFQPPDVGPFPKQDRLPSRNAPCPCGSGRKFKRCCGRTGWPGCRKE